MRRLVTAVVAALALGAPAGALAADCPRTTLGDIEDEVMCPVCGTPLALATETPQAVRERRFIFELVEQCRSKEEIKTALAAEFGESVLALPDDEGFDAAAYVVPALVGLAAVGAIGFAASRWRRRPSAASEPGAGGRPTSEDSARLEADLDRYDL